MKNSHTQLIAACLGIFQLCSLRAADLPLKINNILGEHVISDGVVIEIYTTTRKKGELWYSVTIDGHARGGFSLTSVSGTDSTFWWDAQEKKLWVIQNDTVSFTDYSVPNSASGESHGIAQIQAHNPPPEVLNIIAETTNKKENKPTMVTPKKPTN